MSQALTEPAKLLLLIALLSKDRIISNNGKAFMKDLILRRDPRLKSLIEKFELKETNDMSFLEQVHELIADEAASMYNDLFCDTSLEVGKALSKNEREVKDLSEEKSLIYGEVEFSSFYRVLRKINPAPGLIFYDLGSGTGKAVFAARLTQDFGKCIGVEILHSLHNQATVIVDRYNAGFKNLLALGQSQYANVFEGSFTDFDWSNGDVVFANSTCFSDELMAELSQQAEKLKPGAIVVTFTKGMTSKAFEVLERKRYRMSWGPATVYIHRRLNHDGKPIGPPRLNILPSDAADYDNDYSSAESNQNHLPPHYSYSQYTAGTRSTSADDDDTSYDDDIDYDIRQTEDEEDDEEDDDEDYGGDEGDDEEEENEVTEDNDDGDDVEEDGDYDEDEEEEGENEDYNDNENDNDNEDPTTESDDKISPTKPRSPLDAKKATSPSKSPSLSLKSPASLPQTQTTPSSTNVSQSNVSASYSSPSKTGSLSPKNKTSAAKIYPMGITSPSSKPTTPPSLLSPDNLDKDTSATENIAGDFSALNSPFDSALLMRKRKDHHEAKPANDFAALGSPYDSALLMRKRSAQNNINKSLE